ncbi:hypothetical protein D9757_000621 [Collybiopsis confluens]|uniref:Xylanolytic transcriptional activator regulatory domain-containing protein n=1 Tax=Collybiopsis confluens TaxID=2823264 RepID=A0A8H5I178_9AGAR|nr:hypothetical protein D9757_000621 [Collybiopsis confluens]
MEGSRSATTVNILKFRPPAEHKSATGMSTHLQIRPSPTTRSENLKIDHSDSDEAFLVDNLTGTQRLTLRGSHSLPESSISYHRFHGPSSSINLVDTTRKLKHAHLMAATEERSLAFSTSTAFPAIEVANPLRRPGFWRAPVWEVMYEGLNVDSPELLDSVLEQFPESELAEELIRLYFQHVNPLFPLLNQHIFDRQWEERVYDKDIWFCALLMCIFAVASRWSDDPRVLPRYSKQGSHGSDFSRTGWHFFNIAIDIHRTHRSLLYTASLFEIQTFGLLSLFLRGTTEYAPGWIVTSVGLRKAMDVGAQRKSVYKHKPNAQDELWKRAFWLLIALDRTTSADLGRSCALGEEEQVVIDLDLPLEVDDDYWENQDDPMMAFRQPKGLPSRVSAFNAWIRLTQITAFALRTLYVLNPEKTPLVHQKLLDSESIVMQLDMALAKWVSTLPEHLRWPNQTGDPIFSNQSASLFLTYHLTQILIHRAFIPFSDLLPPARYASQKVFRFNSSFSSSALTICVQAAKACAQVVEDQMRKGLSNVTLLIAVCNSCTTILVLNLWDLRAKEILEQSNTEDVKPQHVMAIQRTRKDIDIFIEALELTEPRYPSVTQILAALRASFPDSEPNLNEQERPFPRVIPGNELHRFEDSPPSRRCDSSVAPALPMLSGRNDCTFRNHSPPTRANIHPGILSEPPPRSLLYDGSSSTSKSPIAGWTTHRSPFSQPRNSQVLPWHDSTTQRELLPFISSVGGGESSYLRPSFRNHDRAYDLYQTNPTSSDFLPTSDARSRPRPSAYYEERGYTRQVIDYLGPVSTHWSFGLSDSNGNCRPNYSGPHAYHRMRESFIDQT